MKRKAFTLIELVVVVLIIGILAAVAAPKMFDTAGNARSSASRQSLTVLRDAVELYKSENNVYPAIGTIATDLKPYIKGQFPQEQLTAAGSATVTAFTGTPAVSGTTGGWLYNATTGEVYVNHADGITW